MNLFFRTCGRAAYGIAMLTMPGLLPAAESQQSKESNQPRIGKYQMMQVVPKGAGGESSDTHEAWILDTETGRVAICGGYSGMCRFIDPRAPAK